MVLKIECFEFCLGVINFLVLIIIELIVEFEFKVIVFIVFLIVLKLIRMGKWLLFCKIIFFGLIFWWIIFLLWMYLRVVKREERIVFVCFELIGVILFRLIFWIYFWIK